MFSFPDASTLRLKTGDLVLSTATCVARDHAYEALRGAWGESGVDSDGSARCRVSSTDAGSTSFASVTRGENLTITEWVTSAWWQAWARHWSRWSRWSRWWDNPPSETFSFSRSRPRRRPVRHVGIVLRDPTFVHPTLTGLYLCHAVHNASRRRSAHIELCPLQDYLLRCQRRGEHVWVRAAARPLTHMTPTLWRAAYDELRQRLTEAVTGAMGHEGEGVHGTDVHWSSACAAWLYVRVGVLDARRTRWLYTAPSHFDQRTERLWYATHGRRRSKGGEAATPAHASDANEVPPEHWTTLDLSLYDVLRGGNIFGKMVRVEGEWIGE